jgi:hypothetical protein
VLFLVLEVAGALVGAGALGPGVAVGGGAAADPGGDLGGLSPEDLAGLVGDPFLGGGLPLVEEGPGGLPAVLELSAVSARKSYVFAGGIVVAIDVTLARR